jgi:integrase
MGKAEVEAFLTDLATSRKCAPSTHKQALAALLFLYREVLGSDLPWMTELGRPRGPVRIPVVLSRTEVAALLSCTDPAHLVVVSLLYGAGLRLMECLSLRTKDMDFDRNVIVIRDAKNRKDRVVMLPKPAIAGLRRQLDYAYSLWAADRANKIPDCVSARWRGCQIP